MARKLTITVDEDVYEALQARVGPGRISRFLNDLARPLLADASLRDGYRRMAADTTREAEALEWSEALIGDVARGD